MKGYCKQRAARDERIMQATGRKHNIFDKMLDKILDKMLDKILDKIRDKHAIQDNSRNNPLMT